MEKESKIKMNYTLDALNGFIEANRIDTMLDDTCFSTILLDAGEGLMESMEISMYVRPPHWNTNTSSYQEFKRMLENGQIDIRKLKGRQKMLFLTCFSDSSFEQSMMVAASENEKEFFKLRKVLRSVVQVLQNEDSYTSEQVHAARKLASWYMECNQKVLHYRQYTEFVKYVEQSLQGS